MIRLQCNMSESGCIHSASLVAFSGLCWNGFNSFFTSKGYTEYSIMTKGKTFAWNSWKFIKNKKQKYHMYIGYRTLLKLLWCYKPGTPIFGQIVSFLFAEPLRLPQIGWGAFSHASSLGSGWAWHSGASYHQGFLSSRLYLSPEWFPSSCC